MSKDKIRRENKQKRILDQNTVDEKNVKLNL
jgi:hypothetical protein